MKSHMTLLSVCLLIGLLLGCEEIVQPNGSSEFDRDLAFVDEAVHLINDVTDAGCEVVHCAFPDQSRYFYDGFNDLAIGSCEYTCIRVEIDHSGEVRSYSALVEFSRFPGECFGSGDILFLTEVDHHCHPSF